jgi:hypothetical protein
MTLIAKDAMRRIGTSLAKRGYRIVVPPPMKAAIFATRQGHRLGPFLPFTDYVAIHELSDHADGPAFERMHAATMAYAESQTNVPRALRYRVPNAVTIGVTHSAPSPTLSAAVGRARLRSRLRIGALESTYLLDLVAETLQGTAMKRTPIRHGETKATSADPTNRVRRMMDELAGELFRANAR